MEAVNLTSRGCQPLRKQAVNLYDHRLSTFPNKSTFQAKNETRAPSLPSEALQYCTRYFPPKDPKGHGAGTSYRLKKLVHENGSKKGSKEAQPILIFLLVCPPVYQSIKVSRVCMPGVQCTQCTHPSIHHPSLLVRNLHGMAWHGFALSTPQPT
jgi:hypothetical protein